MIGTEWLSSLKKYEGADSNKSVFQITITMLISFFLIGSMFTLVLPTIHIG